MSRDEIEAKMFGTEADYERYRESPLEAYKRGYAAGMTRAAEIASHRAKFADVEGADELNAVAQDIRAEITKEAA